MDAEFWWRLDLSSPIVDVRRMAAVQILLEPPPATAGDELAAIAAREEDAETRAMLQQVLEGYKEPADPAHRAETPAASETDDPWAGWSGTPARRLEWLGRLAPQLRKHLAGEAPDKLARENDPLAASALIRIFGRSWPEARLADLVTYVSHASAAVRLAALESLRMRSPALLLPVLPPLLTSDTPRIRGAAVRALAEIDPDEALAHLEALLLDPEPSRRLEGLRCCFHAKFDTVMQLLLKAMAIETDARRLTAYGTLFEINPALEAPFRLYELSERASPACAEVLRRLVASACRVIGNTLLGAGDFQKYRERLQTWVDRRAAAGMAQDIVARAADGRGIDPELTAMLERAKKRPALWEAFQGLATLPMPAGARALFVKAIGADPAKEDVPPPAPSNANLPTEPPPPAELPPPAAQAETAVRKKTPDRLEVLALLGPDEKETASREIVQVLSAMEKNPAPLVAAALRAAGRCSVETQAPAARRALSGSDPGVVSAAIEYLGKFAPDDIEPLLGRFLASVDPRIKAAAVRVLQRSDPLQAVSALKTMLRSKQAEQQKLGMACLVHVEFSLVRDALAELLETNPPAELLETGLCLFQMNADPEGVYLLFLLEKRLSDVASATVRKARREMMSFLAASGRLGQDFGVVESEMETRARAETKKLDAAPPAYAYRVLHKAIPSAGRRGEPEPASRLSAASPRAILATAIALSVVVVLVVAWAVSVGGGAATSSAGAAETASTLPGGRLQIRQVDGWVRDERSVSDEFSVEAETGEIFRVPCRDYDPAPAQGKRFKGALILIRKNADGSWTARRAAAAGLR